MDIQQLLDSARLPEKDVPLCLRGDLLAEWDAASAALAEAQRQAQVEDSLDAGGPVPGLMERVEAIREQMAQSSVTFRLRAVSRRRWTALYAEHPPRDGDKTDALTGFNRDTFYDALTYECIVEPKITPQQWERLADNLSSAQFDTLAEAAWTVNRRDVDVPFSLAASRAPTRTELASERPEDLVSALNGSTDGSLPSSTNTTANGSSPPARKRSGTKNSKH